MKNKIFMVIVLLLITSFAFGQKQFQEESPKKWTQNKINNYYKTMDLNRLANIERPTRRSEVMMGNSIRTLVYDFGSVGAPGREPSIEWPKYSKHGYGYEFGPLVGIEVPIDTSGYFLPYIDKDGEKIVDVDNARYDTTLFIISDGLIDGGAPGASEELSPENEPWGWEPLPGYANEEGGSLALLTKPQSWPSHWDSWPGTYKANASTSDEAIFYVMDDRFKRMLVEWDFGFR